MPHSLLPLVSLVGSLLTCTPLALAQVVAIERVKLTITAEKNEERRPGRLYRVDPKTADRRWVSDVNMEGRLSRPTRCDLQDTFEAETDRAVAYPDHPVRARCSRQLAFSFTRPSFAIAPTGKRSFMDLAISQIDLLGLSQLQVAAKSAGNEVLAKATADSLVSSAATWLGDTKLEKFVERDSSQSFKLILNSDGIAALKERQRWLKLQPSGEVDAETQKAIAGTFLNKYSKSYKTAYCAVGSAEVRCTGDSRAIGGNAMQVRVKHAVE
jgi:hypothetical protein